MTLIHTWCPPFHRNVGESMRSRAAHSSWDRAYKTGTWLPCEIAEKELPRNASTVLNDPRPLPFIRDIFDRAIEATHAEPDDIIVFTNDDIAMAEEIGPVIEDVKIGWSSRKDFVSIPRRVTRDILCKGADHPGVDIVFFPVKSWEHIRSVFPDMLLATERWDLVMRSVLKKAGGTEVKNIIAHAMHMAYWTRYWDNPAAKYNCKLYDEYCAEHGALWNF